MQTQTPFYESNNYYYSENVYQVFCEYIKKTEYGDRLYEFGIPSIIKDKIEFIKQIAQDTLISLKDLFKIFMDRYVFKLFSIIGWSFENLFKKLKQPY